MQTILCKKQSKSHARKQEKENWGKRPLTETTTNDPTISLRARNKNCLPRALVLCKKKVLEVFGRSQVAASAISPGKKDIFLAILRDKKRYSYENIVTPTQTAPPVACPVIKMPLITFLSRALDGMILVRAWKLG